VPLVTAKETNALSASLFHLISSVNGQMREARTSPLWQRALEMGALEAHLMEMTSQRTIRVHICGHAKAAAA
jgi:hypothetical protein